MFLYVTVSTLNPIAATKTHYKSKEERRKKEKEKEKKKKNYEKFVLGIVVTTSPI